MYIYIYCCGPEAGSGLKVWTWDLGSWNCIARFFPRPSQSRHTNSYRIKQKQTTHHSQLLGIQHNVIFIYIYIYTSFCFFCPVEITCFFAQEPSNIRNAMFCWMSEFGTCSGQALDQRTASQGRQPSSQRFTEVQGKASMSVSFWTQQQIVKTGSTDYTLSRIFQSVFYTVSKVLACLETHQGQVGLISSHIGSVLPGSLAIEVRWILTFVWGQNPYQVQTRMGMQSWMQSCFRLVSHLKRFGVLGALRAQKNHALACFQIELTIAYIKHINHSILHISAVLDIPHCFSVLNPAGQPKLARSPAAVFGSVLGGERWAFSRKVWREKEKEEGKKFWYTIIWHDPCYSCYIVHVNSCLCLWRFWCFTDVSCLTCLFALESKHSTA